MKDGGSLRKRGNESAEMSQLLGDTFTSAGSWGAGTITGLRGRLE